MITDADVKKLKKTFVTKDDLKKELKNELKNYPTKDYLGKEFQKWTDIIVKQIIDVVGALGDKIQESLDKLNDHQGTLEDHERRIEKLEEKLTTSY
ncbi:hypothetical protein A3A46_00770 [Candidatus Roizmanbacteria bacterium RIFCSPLOWO2_01_FULL_37_13]|uniref:Uncharacterized protein n=1 Tax=Candidatus Roizmanbacteria bacterium RIFCSPHIGHO2_02_FULL_38_11 TaxID=1802039 RepID=A0A1F7H1Q3_9BACT|nr:MAG: hypothetical protein A3C25_01490 [Candidatus Roizmanbacteria bacterium RIFCSPHIGHO2_02_FULL_38_11]OGK41757.1 MAG: hypothetical protein A3A46_00770 [Candidatus Roizmanbacteria bacterium RIFCSPLOWO2_01_FULL_37_13]